MNPKIFCSFDFLGFYPEKRAKWPFAKTMIAASLFWVGTQTILIIILRKKIPPKGIIQFLIEASLMLIISIVQIVIY